MAIKYLNSINLSQNEIQNVVVHNLASAPSNPKEGQIYYDTSSTEVYVCINETGPVWQSMKGDITAVTASTGLSGGGTYGAVSLALKNNANFTDNTLQKWDDSNSQFVDSLISDDGSTVTVAGNLTVSGTTTTVNTETINLADNIILLNSNLAGDAAPSEDSGIEVERGTAANVSFIWDESADYWSTVDQKLHIGSLADFGNTTGTSEILLHTSGEVKKLDISTALAVLQFVGNSGTESIGQTAYLTIQGDGTTITTDASSNSLVISIADSSETVKGAVELATTAEVITGTDTVRAVTPAGVEAHYDAKNFAGDVGDGSATSYAITHSLETLDVIVQVYEKSSGATVFTDVERTDTDTVTLIFASAPASNAYRVLVTSVA
ncbi:MAG TPA: hypothetical protein DCY51_09930 [Bacteroidetes bacterium]|nr:hypothetical protein [Bacteroidota bacterium]